MTATSACSLIKSGSKVHGAVSKWTLLKAYQLVIFLGMCCFGLLEFANPLWDPHLQQFTLVLGVIGIWRYSWWFVHALRAEHYHSRVFPKHRKKADRLWESGWRPEGVHILVTTFNENRKTTEHMLRSIINEHYNSELPITIWLGSSCDHDEEIIANYLQLHARDLAIDLNIVRQNQPGKRMAIGSVLRAMSRAEISDDELVIFMDGDSILSPGTFEKSFPVFAARPELQALTTDEEVICIGPAWVEQWLKMRFAQRRIAMQSHAVSGKVLTLTGRMSIFKANYITKNEFIRILEADHLDHWLWGRFRFLSGDDKSTWYYLLTQNAEMTYLPDVVVSTVEYVEGSGFKRMAQNFQRWSGNMLRNGSRAIGLGPSKVGFFIWWCLIDQRLAMWTTLISPTVAASVSLLVDSRFIIAYFIWILFSRLLLSLCLFRYSREVFFSWPFLLYINQMLNAVVKVYSLFRLSKQRWTNRGNQSSEDKHHVLKNYMASYTTAVWVASLIVFVTYYTGVLNRPEWLQVRYLVFGN